MAADEAQFVRAALEELRGTQCNIVMRSAVETVTTHRLLLVKLVRQPVEIGVSRQRVMKRRVEHGDLRHGGKKPPHLTDARDVHWIVQGGEWIQRFDLREHVIGNERSLRELLAAVDDTM